MIEEVDWLRHRPGLEHSAKAAANFLTESFMLARAVNKVTDKSGSPNENVFRAQKMEEEEAACRRARISTTVYDNHILWAGAQVLENGSILIFILIDIHRLNNTC